MEPEQRGRPTYPMMVGAVCALTVVSLAVCLLLSFQHELSPQQANLFETCTTTWKMGFGTLLGLIGGKLS